MNRAHKPRELKPAFIVRPRRQFIDEGGRAKFKTSFDGVPEPLVTWKKDEKVLENSDKYKIYEKNSFCFLEVLSVTPDDNGDYTVVISNNLGTAEVSAELEVFSKPKPRTVSSFTSRIEPSFDKELADITTAEGSTLKLECVLKGHPKPFIQWYFNGKMLRRSHGAQESFDGTSATLTIKELCQKHAGQYECLASNILGEVKTACVVTVQGSSSSSDEKKQSSHSQQEITEQSSGSLHKDDSQTMQEKKVSETKKEVNSEKEAKVENITLKTVQTESEPNNTEEEPIKMEVNLTKKKSTVPLDGREIMESEHVEAGAQNQAEDMERNNITGDTEKDLSLTEKGIVKGKEPEFNGESKSQFSKEDIPSVNKAKLTEDKSWSVERKEQIHEEEELSGVKDKPTSEKSESETEKDQLNDEKGQLIRVENQSAVQKEELTEGKGQLATGMTQLTEEKDESNTESRNVVIKQDQATVESENLVEDKHQLVEEKHQLTEAKESIVVEKEFIGVEKEKVIVKEKSMTTEKEHLGMTTKSSAGEEKILVAEDGLEKEEKEEQFLPNEPSSVKLSVADVKKGTCQTLISSEEMTTQILTDSKSELTADSVQHEMEPVLIMKPASSLVGSDGNVITETLKKLEVATLVHKEKILAINKPLQNKDVKEGDTVVLECQILGLSTLTKAISSESELSVIWLKDDRELEPSSDLTMEVSGDQVWLEIRNTQKENCGEYMCVVQHGTTNVWTSCLLSVQPAVVEANRPADKENETKSELVTKETGQPPSFLQPLHDLEVNDGDWVELEVKVKGDKPIKVCWIHGSQDIKDNDKVYQLVNEGDTHKLIIRDAFPEDSGRYICEVYNKYGDDETSCVLTIKEPHGEGTSPFAKVSRRKQTSGSPAVGQHTVGRQPLEQSGELVVIEETVEKQSTNKPELTSEKKLEEVSPDAGRLSARKQQVLVDSPFVRAKKTLGSDVSKAVRTDNTPRVNAAGKTGSRFARSKQMFESHKETKLEKKVEVPVRKLKQKFEFTDVRKKSPQTPVEHQWKRSFKSVKTAEDKTRKEEIQRKCESPLNGVDSSASSKESSVESHISTGSTSESSPVLKESSVVPSSPSLVSPCTERVVPIITKPDPPTIKVQSPTVSPTTSHQLPMVEIILPADLIHQNPENLQISKNNSQDLEPLVLGENLKSAPKTEDDQNHFVSSVNFGTIGKFTSQAPGTSTIEIVPLISSSGQEVIEPTSSHGIIVRSQQSASDIESLITASAQPVNSKPTISKSPKHEVSSLVIETNSSVPAYKAIDFTIDLAANQVINVTPERNDQSTTGGGEFSLVSAQGIAVIGQPIRAVDILTNQSVEVEPKPSDEDTVKGVPVSQVVVTEETSYWNQPVTAIDTMAAQQMTQTKQSVSSAHQNVTMTNPESLPEKTMDNNNEVKLTSFSDARNKFERSPIEGKSDGVMRDKCVTVQQKIPGVQDDSACDSNKPSFIRRPKSVNVNEGESAIFTAQVRGQPMPSVEWQRNGSALSEDERIKFSQSENTHTFEVSHVLSTDAGRYTCVISNSEGSEKCSVSLVVKQAENTEVTDFRGVLKTRPQQKMFHVTSNLNKFTPSKPMGGEQRDFRSVLRRHCSAQEQPKFLTTLHNLEVNKGDKVKLKVKVTGTPHPKITWCHNNEEIKGSQYFKMSYSPLSHAVELVIDEVCPEYAGDYLCKAESEAGYAETSCIVRVKGSHDQVEPSPESETLHTIPARQSDSLVKTGSSQFSSDAKTKLQQSNSNTQSSPTADGHHKEVTRAEIKLSHNESSGSRSGTEAQNCDDRGGMHPIIDVSQVEQSLAGEVKENPEISKCSEDIPREEMIQAQKMISSGDSLAASDLEESCFTDEEPPMIVNLVPQSLNVLIGSDIELCGSFVGTPQPAVKWFVEECRTRTELLPDDRVKITTTDRSSVLFIANAREADTGIYTLEISNHLGFNQLSSSVTIEDKPDPPVSQPFISNIRNKSLILSWYGASYDGGSPILSYMVEMRKEHQSDWVVLSDTVQHTSYAVSDLEPNAGYEFRVRAGNRHGFGEPSKSSDIVFTMEKQPTDIEDELPFEPRVVEVKKDEKFEDSYYLGEQIGRGKFGCVYKCTDKLTGRQFAAKFIKAARVSQKADVKQEISVMNELHHPKLLLLWDAFESRKEIVLVMEHIGGGELLSRVVDEDYVLTERECVHFMRQICDGVKFIHEQNIVHLDLKPENVMCITKNSNEIKIIDFGLARKLDLNKDNKVMFGTAEFVAPEVVNYDAIGTRTDMWSVGVICYILLSGLSPFAGETDAETFSNVTMAQYDFDEEEFEEISDDAKDFINKLLQRERKKRMSARECLKHRWLAQDVKYMKAKRLSTEKHKRFLNRIKWRKAKFAVEMINRMQKVMSLGGFGRSLSRSSTTSSQSRSINGSSSHSRTGSDFSDGCCSLSGDKPQNDATEIEEAANMNNNNNSTSGLHSILNGE